MAKRAIDKGKEPDDLEARIDAKMEARMQRMSDEFNELLRDVRRQVSEGWNEQNSKLDFLVTQQ